MGAYVDASLCCALYDVMDGTWGPLSLRIQEITFSHHEHVSRGLGCSLPKMSASAAAPAAADALQPHEYRFKSSKLTNNGGAIVAVDQKEIQVDTAWAPLLIPECSSSLRSPESAAAKAYCGSDRLRSPAAPYWGCRQCRHSS